MMFDKDASEETEKLELLAFLLKEEGIESPQEHPLIRRGDRDRLPLSFAQQRLWFLDQWVPGSSFYNIPAAVHLTGPLDVTALEQSLNEIVRRHEVLRTTFSLVEGKPVQVIAKSMPLQVSMIDLREIPEESRETEIEHAITEEIQRPFDLSQGPLLRARLLRLAEKEHILSLTMHHIVSDAWSMGIFYRELSTLYRAFTTGMPSTLPELPIQYADFALWQREWLQGENLEAQLSYWRERLAVAPPSLELPTDRPRPPAQTYRGARQSLVLSKTLTEAIKVLSQREGVTLFMTLLAAFKILLHRYTGQDDIVLGGPIAGRSRPEIEGLIGFFVNTLVMHTNISGNPSFREVLGRVCEVCLGAYDHQDLPFEKLVEELRPERNLNQSPLFQVMFAYQNTPRQGLELSGLTVNPLEVDSGTAKFDVALSVVEEREGLKGTFEFNTDLFNRDTIARMLGHFQTLLEGIVTNPEEHISTLPLLTEAQQRQVLVEWNETSADFPNDKCINELFETQVEQIPEVVAIVFENQRLTYQQLNRESNRLAHYLQKLGVGPDVFVGICVERSLEMVVGILGILKAGGAYVPLDPAYPKERVSFMLKDTQAPILLTRENLVEELPDHEAHVICLDRDRETIGRESEENPGSRATADSLAYAIYTSGSTGIPKGVLVEHRGLCNVVEAFIQIHTLHQGNRLLHTVSFNFDAATLHMFMAFCSGATLCLTAGNLLLSGPSLIQTLCEQAITLLPIPASVLSALPFKKLPSLRTISVGAEVCPPEVVARWAPGRRFLNVYGPTEATIVATTAVCTGGDRRPPIGRPIANTQVYILDRHLQAVPIGVAGELHIGGVGLAGGYLNQPDVTGEKFIPNPFRDEAGARLYKTGDLGRYLPDGNIEFLGRMDHQVKIRGFRIELGEIEAVLGQHPAVRGVVVLAREDAPGDKRLVAYIVADQEHRPTIRELRDFLKQKFPDYMAPSVFVTLDSLPLTPNDKVDRRALPVPDQKRPELEKAFVAPRTPLEKTVAGIWSDILGLEKIGVHDNFFELGGHSLLATQLVSRVRDVCQVELPLRSIFEATTIADQALVVEKLLITYVRGLSDEEVIERLGQHPYSMNEKR
ncbi:MAG: amino acid adenylation domain-containing protein [Gemmatimonadota bacterium]|nr:MAG: amino acid adenylation domain-containing protein [Gemmatimonadota bacterium]